MMKSQLSDMQIASILSDAGSGMKALDVCREHGISEAAYREWESKFGDLSAQELGHLGELAADNERLKQMYEDLRQENNALKNLLARKSGSRRDAETQ